jgi:hypothetical protein
LHDITERIYENANKVELVERLNDVTVVLLSANIHERVEENEGSGLACGLAAICIIAYHIDQSLAIDLNRLGRLGAGWAQRTLFRHAGEISIANLVVDSAKLGCASPFSNRLQTNLE